MTVLKDTELQRYLKEESARALSEFQRISGSPYDLSSNSWRRKITPRQKELMGKIKFNPYNCSLFNDSLPEYGKDVGVLTMKLWGHYATPACKYAECQTPSHFDLQSITKSKLEYLSENCITVCDKLSEKLDVKKTYVEDYALFKKNLQKNDYWVLISLSAPKTPHLTVNAVGKDYKMLQEILTELSDVEYVTDFDEKNYPGWQKYPSNKISFDSRKELLKKLKDNNSKMTPYEGFCGE